MFLSFEVRRARKGDCLLLHYGSKASPKLMLIDAGPASVFTPQLRPRLDEIRTARGLGASDALDVDVVMVSHIDDDHINGILQMTKKLSDQERDGDPQFLTSKTLWHNSFDDLLKTTPKELIEAGFGSASFTASLDSPIFDADTAAQQVLASVPQGRTLRDDAKFLHDSGHGWDVNDVAAGKLILADKKTKAKAIDGGLSVTVVGPMRPELEALQKDHDKFVTAMKAGKAGPASLLAAYVDNSVANLSSIVVHVEAGNKRILFTGDARGDKILDGLKMTGLLGTGATAKLKLDVLKVPHHGSSNNMETGFFKQVIADHYVFSGNGEHGNPERETLEMLLTARANDNFTMYFTYPIAEIDVARKADWEKEQTKEKKKLAAAKKKKPAPKKLPKVRANWKASVNGLKELLDKDDPNVHKIKIITQDAEGHLIELLDKINF
jgi:beta-lactamase superfamily II metal-dependent hydrolase